MGWLEWGKMGWVGMNEDGRREKGEDVREREWERRIGRKNGREEWVGSERGVDRGSRRYREYRGSSDAWRMNG